MENFGEYLLGALGFINMILAMRKFEIQWTFCDYVAPVLSLPWTWTDSYNRYNNLE